MNRHERRAAEAQGKRVFHSREEMVTFMRQPEARGKAWHVMVLHDNGCTPHVCVCKPDYLVEPLTGDNYLEGQRAQAKWMKESTS